PVPASPTPTPTGPRLYCRTPATPVPIPDNNPTGVTDSILIADAATVSDLNVRLTVAHTFVADLVVVLTHVESGRRGVILDQPGWPILSGGGCGSDNIVATLDEEAVGLCENLCQTSAPAIGGPCRPNGWLGLFDGDGSSGTWRLEITDTALGDIGALQSWCVEMATGPPPTPSGPAAPVITDVTCDGLDQCFPNFGESFALQFRFYDVNQDAIHWRIDAEIIATGQTYFIDAQDFPPSAGEIITRFHSGIGCAQPPCATVGVAFHVVVSDASGHTSMPRSVDVIVFGTQ
ncbi:MAG: regulatory domain of subtilisin-like proprotein convertase, partial [Deltaproteobacteria bacterium]|nr:regulatory domain of subtilisin-like proprotein convertase [Deltaproteobacteria bacterium]